MDALDLLIAERRKTILAVEAEISAREAEVVRLRESIALATVELAAFEKAAMLRPLPTNAQADDDVSDASDGSDGKRRGRQRGSISHAWRKTLGHLHITGERFDYEKMLHVAQNHGISSSLASIRDRARDYVNQGILEGTPEDGFVVTADAVHRFKFDQVPVPGQEGNVPEVEEPEDVEDDASEADILREQGAPSADPFFGDSEGGGVTS